MYMLFETECLGNVTSFSSRMFTTIGHDTLVQQQRVQEKATEETQRAYLLTCRDIPLSLVKIRN